MATYLDLRTRVLRALIDTPTNIQAEVPLLVNEALSKLQNKHNFFVMQARQAYITAVVDPPVRVLGAVPTDWKAWNGRPYYVEDLGSIHWLTIAPDRGNVEYYRNTDDTGPPRFILQAETDINGVGNFEIFPFPDGLADYTDGEYRVEVPYWRYLPRLVADADTNWFLQQDDAIQYIIREATANGFELNEDDIRSDRWVLRQKATYNDIVMLDKHRWLSGMDTLVPHLGANESMVAR